MKITKKNKIVSKNKVKKTIKAKEIPKKFLNHVLALGFQAEDAPLLYEHKEQWVGVALDSKIKCPQQGCKYETEMYQNCLVDHCRKVHGWRDYPCNYENCNWVAHSSLSYKSHTSFFHERHKNKYNSWKCEFPGCEASFENQALLKRHTDVHNDVSFDCHFCPYRNSQQSNYKGHMFSHFEKTFNCDLCDKIFGTKGALNVHIENIHEAIQYGCPLCDQKGNLKSIRNHIRKFHKVKHSFDREKKHFVVHT